jgi:hypothetical protein
MPSAAELGVEGVAVGAALAKLRHTEISGAVSNADDARRYLARCVPKKC